MILLRLRRMADKGTCQKKLTARSDLRIGACRFALRASSFQITSALSTKKTERARPIFQKRTPKSNDMCAFIREAHIKQCALFPCVRQRSAHCFMCASLCFCASRYVVGVW
jgi:hypothetical protein